MTNTLRIYNRRIKKSHRINLQTDPVKDLKRQVETGEINNPLRNAVHDYGFVFHPYAELCMGKCPQCRDRSRDPHHIRKVRKVEFRCILRNELNEM